LLYNERNNSEKVRILNRFSRWLKRRNGYQKEMQKEIDQVSKMLYSLKKEVTEIV
jgi:hypothetical protein